MQEFEREPDMVAKSITLWPRDWEMARKVAQSLGQRGYSAGLRAIIEQYRRQNQPKEANNECPSAI